MGIFRYNPTKGFWEDAENGVAAYCMDIMREMVTDPVIYQYFEDDKGRFQRSRFDNHWKEFYGIGKLHQLIRGVPLMNELLFDLELLDSQPKLLNSPRGVINLETGRMMSHSPDYYFTKSTRGVWSGDLPDVLHSHDEWADCSLWTKSLYDIMLGDVQMCQFLQRLLGYSLLGDNPEQILAFFYGTGANGKSLVTNTIGHLLGEYHRTIRAEYLMHDRDSASPGKLSAFAKLAGARVVTTSEIEENQRWAEATLKDLTGSDPIQAKFMGKDQFEYTPQSLLIIRGNHRPRISGTDKASWRRFLTVQFAADFENDPVLKEQRDIQLFDKLRTPEAMNDVMGWLVRGALEYGRIGLAEPDKVIIFKEAYRAEMNPFGTFLSECCIGGYLTDTEGQTIVSDQYNITFDSLLKALEIWIDLNPGYGLTVDRNIGIFRDFVSKQLKAQGVQPRIVKNPVNRKTERRYPLVLNEAWASVIQSRSVGGMLKVLPGGSNGNGGAPTRNVSSILAGSVLPLVPHQG